MKKRIIISAVASALAALFLMGSSTISQAGISWDDRNASDKKSSHAGISWDHVISKK